jgi:hypothetical protein
MIFKPLIFAALLPLLQGCWNTDNAKEIHFGDVSIGKQMIDLKQALEAGAVTVDEHARLKQALMSLDSLCESEDIDEEG